MRVTNPQISDLESNGIFVPGTNEAGIHGAGAAALGYKKFGMKWGKGVGHSGECYGIPTKDFNIKTLPVINIKHYVDQFIDYAKSRPDLTFHVTEIGCGLAGYEPKDIAPLFKGAINIDNIHLPQRFWEVLKLQ